MFDLDHAAAMQWVTDIWALVNTGGYASVIINLVCGLGVVLVFKALFSNGADDEGASDNG